tara:strand:+ start:605 stop:1915 length:1311 start_codon:yes stop_codon:yes gene_type:complete
MAAQDPYEGIRTGSNNPGSFDIVKNYDWTSVPRNRRLRDEAPSAYITAYELKYSQLKQFIDGYMNVFSPQNSSDSYNDSKNPGLDFYKGLYSVARTPLARFNFPFFSDEMRSFSSEFENTFSPISQRGAQMLGGDQIMGLGGAAESLVGGTVATGRALGDVNVGGMALQDVVSKGAGAAMGGMNKMFGTNMNLDSAGKQTVGAPGTYIETPKFYQYSDTDNGVQIGFTLSNTLEDDGFNLNYDFITKFTKLNRPYRRGPIGMNFPAIYNLVVPGVRYIQWASLESFNVGMLGSRRKIYIPGKGDVVVPEAYTCNFSFKSLTLEPSNFIDELTEFNDGFGGYADNRDNLEGEIADIQADRAEERARQEKQAQAIAKYDAELDKFDEEQKEKKKERERSEKEDEETAKKRKKREAQAAEEKKKRDEFIANSKKKFGLQ